jgi:large repetitive protein
MEACLRGFDLRCAPFALSLAAIALGCSTRLLVAVDPVAPDPCADGGIVGCFFPNLADGLIAWWRLDDGTGSATAQDATLYNNNGVLYQLDPATAWTAGRAGEGVDVGAKGWIGVIPSPSIDSIDNQVTVVAWVNLEGTVMADPGNPAAGWATALSRQKGTTLDQHYHLALNLDAHPHLFIMPAGGDVAALTAPDPVTRGTWVHIAGTYDGVEARLFVSGVLVAHDALTGRFAADTTPVIIGGNGNSTSSSASASNAPTELFPGLLDEVLLYRRALSEDEVRQLAAGALPAGAPRDAGTTD